MFDLVTMGEILVDFTPCEGARNESPRFEANAGGAPANVAVGASRLGLQTAFIGKLGVDGLSLMLRETLIQNRVDVQGLKMDTECDPALAFVHLDSHGDRSFSFFRRKTADTMLRTDENSSALILDSKAFYFGSLTLTSEPSRSTVLAAAETAKQNGLLVAFDPNYRKPLWKNASEFSETVQKVLPLCDVLKISQEELELLTAQTDISNGMKKLAETYGIPLVFTTLGAQGCKWLFRNIIGVTPAFDVPTVDTTGAGDSFLASVLYQILHNTVGWDKLYIEDIKSIARFASAASSLTTMKSGAIQAMPTLSDVNKLLRDGKTLMLHY